MNLHILHEFTGIYMAQNAFDGPFLKIKRRLIENIPSYVDKAINVNDKNA